MTWSPEEEYTAEAVWEEVTTEQPIIVETIQDDENTIPGQ